MLFLVHLVLGVVNRVNFLTGNFFYDEVDSNYLTRTYNSLVDRQGYFGYGWTTLLESQVMPHPEGGIIFFLGPNYIETRFTSATDTFSQERVNAGINQIIEALKKTQNLASAGEKIKREMLLNTPSERTKLYQELKLWKKPANGTYTSSRNTLIVDNAGYRVNYADGREFVFNGEGKLLKYKEGNLSLMLTYKNNKLDKLVNERNKETYNFSWNNEVINKVTGPNKLELFYTYENMGPYKMLKEFKRGKESTNYRNQMITVSQGLAHLRLVQVIKSNENLSVTFDQRGLVQQVIEPNGEKVRYNFSGSGEKITTQITVDPVVKGQSGQIITNNFIRKFNQKTGAYELQSLIKKDPGGQKEYTYDDNGFINKSITTASGSTFGPLIYLYKRNNQNRIIEKQQGAYKGGKLVHPSTLYKNTYAANGLIQSVVRTTFDAQGKELLKDGVIYTYDSQKRVISAKDLTGDVINYTYKDTGIIPSSMAYTINKISREMILNYDSKLGKVTIATLKEKGKEVAKSYYQYAKDGTYIGATVEPFERQDDFQEPFNLQESLKSIVNLASEEV